MTEFRIVTIPAGHIHHHAGKMFAGPCDVLMGVDDAEWLVSAIVGARIKRREEAAAVMSVLGKDDGQIADEKSGDPVSSESAD